MENIEKNIKKCKNSIKKYNNASTERMSKLYRRSGFGKIACAYDEQISNIVYSGVVNLLYNRYGNIIDKEELLNRVSQYGKIFTMSMEGKNGIYDKNTANIGINHFLNRISVTLVHEIIHKMGALSFETGFYELPNVYIEAGAEIISSEILKNGEGREILYHKNWGKLQDKLTSNQLLSNLVIQMNTALGEEHFVDTIINGKDSFRKNAEEILGEDNFKFYTEELEKIYLKEKEYWKNFKTDNPLKKIELYEQLNNDVHNFQNKFMIDVFDKKAEKISTLEEAEEYLKQLKEFSDGRIKTENDNKVIEDTFFVQYFEKKQKELEDKLNVKLNVEYEDSEWMGKYPIRELIKAKDIDEQFRVKNLAARYNKKISFWHNLFRKQTEDNEPKQLAHGTGNEFEERIKEEIDRLSSSKNITRTEIANKKIEDNERV